MDKCLNDHAGKPWPRVFPPRPSGGSNTPAPSNPPRTARKSCAACTPRFRPFPHRSNALEGARAPGSVRAIQEISVRRCVATLDARRVNSPPRQAGVPFCPPRAESSRRRDCYVPFGPPRRRYWPPTTRLRMPVGVAYFPLFKNGFRGTGRHTRTLMLGHAKRAVSAHP